MYNVYIETRSLQKIKIWPFTKSQDWCQCCSAHSVLLTDQILPPHLSHSIWVGAKWGSRFFHWSHERRCCSEVRPQCRSTGNAYYFIKITQYFNLNHIMVQILLIKLHVFVLQYMLISLFRLMGVLIPRNIFY